jgi:O-antigen ligase
LQIIGGLVGLFISIGSSSRGGWLAVPFIFILMFVIRCGDILNSPKIIRARLWLRTILFISLLGSIGICALYFSDSTRERLITGYYGVYQWFSGENLMTSAGIRLSMWKLGLQFSNQSLLFGYGEEKNLTLLLQNIYPNISENMIVNAIADTGPHSDIMSKLLSAGIFGLAAYFGLLMLPFIIFWQYRNTVNLDKRAAARVGLFYITGVFIAGLSNEQLSLKYLCTFYGLMIATLLAQVLHKPFTAENLKTGTFS